MIIEVLCIIAIITNIIAIVCSVSALLSIPEQIERAVLKKHGWKTHKTTTLKTWKKERLIEEIQALENNYACALDMSDNQYNLLQKMDEEKAKLKLQIIKSLEEENKQLKARFEKLLDFVAENYIEECDVCELTDTCINSEGVCPFAWSNRNIKDLIIKYIDKKILLDKL